MRPWRRADGARLSFTATAATMNTCVPGSQGAVLYNLYHEPYKRNSSIVSILQMRTLRHREENTFALSVP